MRNKITTLLELVGMALVSTAAWQWDERVGLASAGAALVVVGVSEGRK